MRVGLFFGSFNPPHIGHTAIAEFMLHDQQADEIWMVVSPQNPHKDQADLLDENERLRLVKRALDGHPRIKPCNFEFNLPRPSYTVDTMRAMREKHPEDEFFIIMGSDNINSIEGWKDYQELLQSHPVAVYPRPGYAIDTSFINQLPGDISITESPVLDISSTQIRTSIQEGRDCRFLMREAVWRALERQGFYTNQTNRHEI